jgi:hypothetical protein
MALSLPSSFSFPPATSQWGGGATALTSRGPHYFYVSVSTSGAPGPGVVMETVYGRGFVDAVAFDTLSCWSTPVPVTTPPLMSVSRKDGQGTPITAPSGVFAIGDRADGIFLIWIDSAGSVWGSRSEKPGSWGPRFQFAGVTVALPASGTPSYGLSAYWYGDTLVLVWWGSNGPNATAFPSANLKPSSSSNSGAAWTSSASVTFPSGKPANPCVSAVLVGMPCIANPNAPAGGSYVATSSAADTTSFQPVVFLSVSDTTGTSSPFDVYCWFIDPATALPTSTPYENYPQLSGATLGTFTVDPSGVVFLYWQVPGAADLAFAAYTDQASGMALATTATSTIALPGTAAPPSIAYVIGAESKTSIGATLTGGSATALPSASAQVYLSVFGLKATAGSNSGSGVLFFAHYSTLHRVASYINLAYVAQDGAPLPAIVAKGIIDGPIPIPSQNLVMYNDDGTAGTIKPWDFYKSIAKIVYGENSARDVTHLVAVTGEVVKSHELNVLGGYQAEASVSLGFGEGANASVSYPLLAESLLGGSEKQWSKSEEQEKSLSLGVATVNEANVIGLTTRVLPPPPGADQPVLNQQGFVFGSTLAIVPVALYSLPPGATELSGRPSMVTFFPRSVMHVGAHYTANYAFTPGNLATYSVENINQKMADAYTDWLPKKKNGAVDPFGAAYSSNYFKNVVEKHALRIGPGGKNYLEFSVSNDGLSETRFNLSQERFREWAVTVSKSTYKASVSSDAASILGAGATIDYKSGKQVTFTANTTQQLDESREWGISVSIDDFPQATLPNQGQICGYTFRLYFLPSNPLWVQELLCFSDYNDSEVNPANAGRPLDPGAAPWKIMFVVEQDSVVKLTAPTPPAATS